jgi:hypothetical protein
MNLTLYCIAPTLLLWSFGHMSPGKASAKMASLPTDTIPAIKSSSQNKPFFQRFYFSKPDAELILGEKAYLSDSSSTTKKDTLEIKRAYTANSRDPQTGKTGVIYFMIEEYSRESSAKDAYHFFKSANEKHEGVRTVHDMGDEAYFHTDGTNFYFILVRKGKIMFRMKVNKTTGHTSLKGFNLVSKKISDAL